MSFGERLTSVYIDVILGERDQLTTADIAKLSNLVYLHFFTRWDGLYKTLNFDYNPIENYSMTEKVNRERQDTRTTDFNSTSSSQVYGFDNASAVDTDKSNSAGNNKSVGSDAEEATTTRSGNIGVTTSQEMIEAERRVKLYDFYRQVITDIADILVTKIY